MQLVMTKGHSKNTAPRRCSQGEKDDPPAELPFHFVKHTFFTFLESSFRRPDLPLFDIYVFSDPV